LAEEGKERGVFPRAEAGEGREMGYFSGQRLEGQGKGVFPSEVQTYRSLLYQIYF